MMLLMENLFGGIGLARLHSDLTSPYSLTVSLTVSLTLTLTHSTHFLDDYFNFLSFPP
jgi:hypothetical protein